MNQGRSQIVLLSLLTIRDLRLSGFLTNQQNVAQFQFKLTASSVSNSLIPKTHTLNVLRNCRPRKSQPQQILDLLLPQTSNYALLQQWFILSIPYTSIETPTSNILQPEKQTMKVRSMDLYLFSRLKFQMTHIAQKRLTFAGGAWLSVRQINK